MKSRFLFTVLVVLPSYGLTKYLEEKNIVHPGSDYIHDDIRLTPEQELMRKERGFYTAGKWPLKNGIVTVPYYFDWSIPYGDFLRNVVKTATSKFEPSTCIRWVETTAEDSQNKVKIFRGRGCFSNVGMIEGGVVGLSLGEGCDNVGLVLHEMGHALGLYHTQSRPDRDKYVKVWINNVEPGMRHNFEMSNGDLYDVPYDYRSMMHYGNDYFSINGSFTLTPHDPFAINVIGRSTSTLRWSDATFLNRAYTCDKIFAAGCPGKTCANGGYVLKDCTCRCPENTSGQRCETVTGEFFSEVPKCGGTITTETEFMSNGYGSASTVDRCIFKFVAPSCKLPAITITAMELVYDECSNNRMIIQISKEYFGPSFCKTTGLPIGKTFLSDDSVAALYFHSNTMGSPDIGFKANVKFVDDPNCGKPVTTTTAPSTATVAPPSGSCILTNLGVNSFKYTTPGYPKAVAPNMQCTLDRKLSQHSDLIFSKVQLSYNFGESERMDIKERFNNAVFNTGSDNRVFYSLWPFTITYIAGPTPGQGFSATYTPVSGLPHPCNGQTVNMVKGEVRVFKNPLVGFAERKASCAFKIETIPGAKLTVQGTTLGLTTGELLLFTPALPTFPNFRLMSSSPITTQSNLATFYYIGAATYTTWEFKVTVV